MQIFKILPVLILCLMLAGCFSPTYLRPEFANMPMEYKEEGDWKTAEPQDSLDKGNWWERFKDPMLNELMARAHQANQNIAIAAANFRQARTQIATARASFMPSAEASAQALRSGSDKQPKHQSQYSLAGPVNWEITFWNAIPAFEASRAQTEASAADYATMRLSIQSELAQNYFQIRTLDVQIELCERTKKAYEKAVTLTRNQYLGGIVTPSDVAQAEAQLASADAELSALMRQRDQVENAISVLVGEIASNFSLPKGSLLANLPKVPSSLPSALLERRPDIAGSERNVMVANQEIGIARAAWFPSISLGGSLGLESAAWHSSPLQVWSVGPSAALSIFEGGKKLAASDSAWAGYESSVASYRQTVLEAFQEVENGLSGLRHMAYEAEAREKAFKASETALRLSMAQYEAGMTSYLQVVTDQTNALANERQSIQIKGERLMLTVGLIKALGGGWDSSELPKMRTGEKIPQEGKIE